MYAGQRRRTYNMHMGEVNQVFVIVFVWVYFRKEGMSATNTHTVDANWLWAACVARSMENIYELWTVFPAIESADVPFVVSVSNNCVCIMSPATRKATEEIETMWLGRTTLCTKLRPVVMLCLFWRIWIGVKNLSAVYAGNIINNSLRYCIYFEAKIKTLTDTL